VIDRVVCLILIPVPTGYNIKDKCGEVLVNYNLNQYLHAVYPGLPQHL
jgi:hypothetical protein